MDRRFVRRAFLLLAVIALAGLPAPALAQGDDPPPPTDAEATKFFAVYSALLDDPSLADEACGLGSSDADGDSGSQDLAALGRKIDTHPSFGPLVRRQGLSGRRFIEVTMHLFAGYLGLAIADDADRGKPKQGGVGPNRAALLGDSPAARVAAAHQEEMARLQARTDELCAADEEEGYDEEEEGYDEVSEESSE